MSTYRDDSNITIGRQAWSSLPVHQMLGAGTSNNPNASEVGLSAQPAAMQHGLVVEPPRQQIQLQHAAPVQAHLPQAAPVVRTAQIHQLQPQQQYQQPTSSMQRSVSTAIAQQRQRMAPVIRRKEAEAAQQQAGGGGDQGPQVGQAQRVAPSATQTPWYEMALQHVKAAVLGTPPDTLSLGPPWTKWPDFARTNNINALVMGLWPSVSEAVTQQLVIQMAPQLMADMAKTYGAGVLTGLELLEFDLGEVPPRLDGIKVYGREVGDEQVLMELAVGWGSNIKVSVGVTVQLFGYTIKLPITVQRLQLHTRLRVAAQPLLDHPPYVGSVGVSLIEPPFIEFDLPVAALGGLDLLALPGIRGLFRLGVRLAARQFAVYPKGIAIPLVEGGASAGGPEGMLEVHLVRVSGLRSEDLIGHSDPFVVLRLREGRQVRSRTIHNNNSPEFDETFKLLVDDCGTQVLQLIVMDEDLVGGGKVMGVAQMPLKQSAAVSVPHTKVPLTLTVHKLMATDRGVGGMLQLPIRVAGLPLTAAAKGGSKVYQSLAGALGVGQGGQGRTTGVTNMSKVLDETGWLGPSEEFLDEMGKTGWKDSNNQQQQQQQGTNQQDGSQAKASSKEEWGGFSITAAPAGPEGQSGASGQPGSPTGSTSSFFSAFSTPSSSSSTSASAAGSRSSSPGRVSAFRPAAAASPAGAAAVAAAEAAAAAEGAKERRLSASEVGRQAGMASSGLTAPQAGYGAVRPGGTGLSRLNSQSAPLLHVYGAETDSQQQSKVVLVSRPVVSSSSSRSSRKSGVNPDNATAPPAEVVEHQKRAQQQEENKGGEAVKQMQKEMTPGEAGKGLAGDQLKAIYRGTVFLELTYTPFKKPLTTATGAGASPAGTAARVSAADNTAVMPHDRGILAVTLVCARRLGGWQGEADPYVTLSLMDSAGAVRPGGSGGAGANGRDQTMRSSTIYNEDSPRWNEKFDFIDVRTDSIMLATVWDQATIVDAATSLKISRERFKDQVLGRLKVPVMDVANAGRIRRRWPLAGAMMGELELVLQWIPVDQLR